MSSAMLRLPYAFARQHGVLIDTVDTEKQRIFCRLSSTVGLPFAALAEIRRVHGVQLRPEPLGSDEFDRLLAETYAQGDQTAAEVADDIGQDLDITRLVDSLPPIEDLLDSQHDAPIIRMILSLIHISEPTRPY